LLNYKPNQTVIKFKLNKTERTSPGCAVSRQKLQKLPKGKWVKNYLESKNGNEIFLKNKLLKISLNYWSNNIVDMIMMIEDVNLCFFYNISFDLILNIYKILITIKNLSEPTTG